MPKQPGPRLHEPNKPGTSSTDYATLGSYATSASAIERLIPVLEKCPCQTCRMKLFDARINLFVCRQIVAAMQSGDTSKLDALVAEVNKLYT